MPDVDMNHDSIKHDLGQLLQKSFANVIGVVSFQYVLIFQVLNLLNGCHKKRILLVLSSLTQHLVLFLVGRMLVNI